jgi:hypothetical protein
VTRLSERVTIRFTPAEREGLEEQCEKFGVTISDLLRNLAHFGLEAQGDSIGAATSIAIARQEIIEEGRPIDQAGGFQGRVQEQLEQRFRNGYEPKWLAAKAENYRREARVLEEKLPDHPDAPEIRDGEFVEHVDQALRNVLEAHELSDWEDRYDNPLKRLDGVESGEQKRRQALLLTRTAMRMDRDLETLGTSVDVDRRVRVSDLPDMADEQDDLPAGVDTQDLVDAARDLVDRGLDPDEIETDPAEFDPFGCRSTAVETTSQVSVSSSESTSEVAESDGEDDQTELTEDDQQQDSENLDGPPEPDGGTVVETDGGGNESIVAYSADSVPVDGEAHNLTDLVEWAADLLDEADVSDRDSYRPEKNEARRREARERAQRRIETRTDAESGYWQGNIMDRHDLTVDDLLELANDYNDERTAALLGERDTAPDVVEENGGVRVE